MSVHNGYCTCILYVTGTLYPEINFLCRPGDITFDAPLQQGVHPKENDIVSYYYATTTPRGVPVRPEIYRIRQDMTWDDLVNEANISLKKERAIERKYSALTQYN